jgi:uncharacterized membrane protein
MRNAWIWWLVAAGSAACGDDSAGTSGEQTGAVCDSSLTYEGFVEGFMQDYCTRCHSSELSASERMGAPLGHDFDSRAGIDKVLDHVGQEAAGGPDGVNTAMPPDGVKPSTEQRKMLGAWLACEKKLVAGTGQ